MTIFKTDHHGRIVAVAHPQKGTESFYDGYYCADIPDGATHYRNGVFASQPPCPGAQYVFDETLFEWVFCEAAAFSHIRRMRDVLLAACDWTQLPDVPSETRAKWTGYRQALRDVTSQPDLTNVIWPTPPS